MIGKISGIVDEIGEDFAIIDVVGIGLIIFCSTKTLAEIKLIKNSQSLDSIKISLITETIIKEGSIELYGFLKKIEKIWFLELHKVQGVGAKMALKILSSFSIEELAQCLISGDIKSFLKISGIGTKLANRLVTELKDSPKKLGIDLSSFNLDDKNIEFLNNHQEISNDAVSALENLGYRKIDCLKIINLIIKNNPEITLESLITNSLRELSKNKFN
jgi:Holliday junction DNA helicase RuvA